MPAYLHIAGMWLPNINPEGNGYTFTFIIRHSRQHVNVNCHKPQRQIESDQQKVPVRPGSPACSLHSH